MSFLYRHALFLTRKTPYIEWANSGNDGVSLSDELALQQRTVYLVPEIDGEPVLADLIEDFWERIFLEELSAWVTSEEDWPQSRTREMFDEWFDVELNASVYDLAPEEPLTQDDVDIQDIVEAESYCANCGLEVAPEEGRFAGFKLADRQPFEPFEGRVLPLSVDDETTVLCIITPRNSEDASSGDDVLVRVCSSGCEKGIRKIVPQALRDLARVRANEL